jgi:hypothetical protein
MFEDFWEPRLAYRDALPLDLFCACRPLLSVAEPKMHNEKPMLRDDVVRQYHFRVGCQLKIMLTKKPVVNLTDTGLEA